MEEEFVLTSREIATALRDWLAEYRNLDVSKGGVINYIPIGEAEMKVTWLPRE